MRLDILDMGIECKECGKQWKAAIPISGNTIEAFAAVCECGNLLVGNYHFELHRSLEFNINLTDMQKKKVFLNNGHFNIFTLDKADLKNFDELFME